MANHNLRFLTVYYGQQPRRLTFRPMPRQREESLNFKSMFKRTTNWTQNEKQVLFDDLVDSMVDAGVESHRESYANFVSIETGFNPN